MSRRAQKDTTEEYRSIDVRRLQREGLLSPGRSFIWSWTLDGVRTASISARAEPDRLVLSYAHSRYDSEPRSMNYAIQIDRTPCNYGGERAWFLCPARGCNRRSAILYCSGIFACRSCLQLAYESQREQPCYRALRKAQAIRVKLGGTGNMIDFFPPRPKGMHWRTYLALQEVERAADARATPPWLLKALSAGSRI